MKRRLYILIALTLILALCFSTMLMACESKRSRDDDDEEEEEVSKDIYNGQSRKDPKTVINYLDKGLKKGNYTFQIKSIDDEEMISHIVKGVIEERQMCSDYYDCTTQYIDYHNKDIHELVKVKYDSKLGMDGIENVTREPSEHYQIWLDNYDNILSNLLPGLVNKASYDKEKKALYTPFEYEQDWAYATIYLRDDGVYIDIKDFVVNEIVIKDVGTTKVTKVDVEKLLADAEKPEPPAPKPEPPAPKPQDVEVIDYYVGTDNGVDLNKVYTNPNAVIQKGSVSFTGNICYISPDTKVRCQLDNGKTLIYNVHTVPGLNVYEDAEQKMIDDLSQGKSIIMHSDVTTKGITGFTLSKDAKLYGNGHAVHGDTIAAPKNQNKDSSSWGNHLFIMKGGSSIDGVNIIVNTVDESKPMVVQDFEYSGSGIEINEYYTRGEYLPINITNCVVRNGNKLLNIIGGNVHVKGCLFENSSDASIGSGSIPKKGANIVLENVAIRNSLIAGILFYGYEKVEAGNIEYQQTLTIKGFLDIYNWVEVDKAMVVPNTEKPVADIFNRNFVQELKGPKYTHMVYDMSGKKYVHLGIMRLATGNCKEQNPAIYYEDASGNRVGGRRGQFGNAYKGYSEKVFPMPKWMEDLGIINSIDYISYVNPTNGTSIDIMPNSEMPVDIMDHLRYGRKADGTANIPDIK